MINDDDLSAIPYGVDNLPLFVLTRAAFDTAFHLSLPPLGRRHPWVVLLKLQGVNGEVNRDSALFIYLFGSLRELFGIHPFLLEDAPEVFGQASIDIFIGEPAVALLSPALAPGVSDEQDAHS